MFLIDLFVTAATMLKWHYAGGIYGNVADTLKKTKSTLGRKTYEIISRRMYKAFPELIGQEINDEVGFGRTKDRIFAKGLCIDKLVWIFFVSALIGDWVETVFVWATSRCIYEQKQSYIRNIQYCMGTWRCIGNCHALSFKG